VRRVFRDGIGSGVGYPPPPIFWRKIFIVDTLGLDLGLSYFVVSGREGFTPIFTDDTDLKAGTPPIFLCKVFIADDLGLDFLSLRPMSSSR
jgi:hypothetical protein